jgi:hypothetical protein
MQARKHKLIEDKDRCDRCGGTGPVRECEFAFRHSFNYWRDIVGLKPRDKGLKGTGKHRELNLTFDHQQPPAYWMDLCDVCWAACSEPFDDTPDAFWQTVLSAVPVGSRAVKSVGTVKAATAPLAPSAAHCPTLARKRPVPASAQHRTP